MIVGLYPIVGDILHAGHILAMKEAKENCDHLIVAMNCTPDKKNPVQSIYERWTQLSAVKYVDELIPYGGRKDLEMICNSVKHDIRFVGSDYLFRDFDGKVQEEQKNVEFYYLDRSHGLSSTELKERIVKGKEK